MIKISVSSYCMNLPSLDDNCRILAGMGYRHLELVALGGDKSFDITKSNPDELKILLAKYNMNLAALYIKAINVWSDDNCIKDIEYNKTAIDFAYAMGCSRLVFTPLLPRDGYDYDKIIVACKIMADYIGDRKMTICLENHHNWPLSYTEDYVRVFSLINDPRISITVDTGHFTGSQVDVINFIDKFAPHIKHVHLKDHINTQSVAFGCGNTDNLAIMNHLVSKGFSGYATVELEVEDTENIQQYLKKAREYCLNYLGLVE